MPKPRRESVRHQFGSPALPWDMVVYLMDGTDDYLAYLISGGS
jgi:hypothetical protein